MKRVLIILIPLCFLFAERGDLISADVMATKDPSNNQLYIDDELSALAGESFFNLTVEYGFWLYKLVYETIDAEGNTTHASGVVAYPSVDIFDVPNQAFPILSYQHGTVVEKDAVKIIIILLFKTF